MLDAPVERLKLSDVAFERIRGAIITGELAPGEKVRDSELSARLGLSRTPVREAMARLADAGLVIAKPGVHTKISGLSQRDVENTLSVLQVMDELAVRSAVPRMTRDDLEVMRDAHETFAEASQRGDAAAALEADDAFHGVVIEAADNPVIARVIDQLHPMLHRVLYRKFSSLMGGQETVGHHEHLLVLCEKGQAEEAAQVSAAHWRHLGGLIDAFFDAGELTNGF